MSIENVFFSFSFTWDGEAWENDIDRVMKIREKCLKFHPDARFADKSEVEEINKKGDQEIRNWYNKQLSWATVTCIIIATHTQEDQWVRGVIDRSIKWRKGLFGIYVHKVGLEPYYDRAAAGDDIFPHGYKLYDWVDGKGSENIWRWVDDAALLARHRR